MKHYLIYIPGLGAQVGSVQDKAVRCWRIFGVKSEFFMMHWAGKEPYSETQTKLIERIKELKTQGYIVSLVGTSAGGGATINTFVAASELLHRAVSVCGTIGGAEKYSSRTYQQNPMFEGSMQTMEKSLAKLTDQHKQRILAIRPLADSIVYPRFAVLDGAHNRLIFTIGHVFSIAYSITLGMPKIIRFIKRT